VEIHILQIESLVGKGEANALRSPSEQQVPAVSKPMAMTPA